MKPLPFRRLNGGPKKPTEMSAEQRSILLAKWGAPTEMRLITQDELNNIMTGVAQGNARLRNREMTLAAIFTELGVYWKNEPDPINAVGAAIYDADKFKAMSETGIARLKATKERFDAVVGAIPVGAAPAWTVDLIKISGEIGALIDHFEKIRDARRERKKLNA